MTVGIFEIVIKQPRLKTKKWSCQQQCSQISWFITNSVILDIVSVRKFYCSWQVMRALKLRDFRNCIKNIGLYLFHIHYKKNEWLDKKNYEWLIRVNKRPFWKAKWAYKLHIFSRVKRVKKYATSKAIWPWKKAVYSQGSTVHSFECTKSFMNFRINVEHECLYFSKDLWNQFEFDPMKVI